MYVPLGASVALALTVAVFFASLLIFLHLILIKLVYFPGPSDRLNMIATLGLFFIFTVLCFILSTKATGEKGVFCYFIVFFMYLPGVLNLLEALFIAPPWPVRRVLRAYFYIFLKTGLSVYLLLLVLSLVVK